MTINAQILDEKISSAGAFVEWLRIRIHEKELPANNRIRASASCFGIAQEHHHAIVLLIGERLYASGFALLRIAFEAYIRGEWLAYCATDMDVERFLRAVEPPKIDSLLQQIENIPEFSEKVLSQFKLGTWKAMCAYTHTGGLHVQRWNTEASIEPNYSQDEIESVLLFAEIIGTLSVLGVAGLADDTSLAQTVLGAMKTRLGA